MDGIISKQELEKAAQALLDVLKGVSDTNDLDKMLNEGFYMFPIELSLRRSNAGTKAYTISYIIPEKGIPLEVKLNKQLEYFQIITKSGRTLPDYTDFATDPFGNVISYKMVRKSSVNLVRDELEMLKSSLHD